MMSYKFASSQEHFDEWVHLIEGTPDCCHDLPIQDFQNTASHMYLRFHIDIENLQLGTAGCYLRFLNHTL
jgi:hypothetical protein